MKPIFLIALLMITRAVFADGLPIFTTQPVNQTVNPGGTAILTAAAPGATGYQWMFNGTNITGAIGSTLILANVQTAKSGYYMVMAMNATGWVPSQMAYLSLDYTFGGTVPAGAGTLPFSNTNDTYFQGDIESVFGSPSTPDNGTVQIVAGPQLDELQPVGQIVHYRATPVSSRFFNGYYASADQRVSTMAPGQAIFYSVICFYTNGGTAYAQPSTVMNLNAGTNGAAASPAYGLKFPGWFAGENPQPWMVGQALDPWPNFPNSATQQTRVVGETFSLTNSYNSYTDYGIPQAQWRKNGIKIGSVQSFVPILGFPEGANGQIVLTIANAQPTDAGVYDVEVRGNDWFIGSKITVSVQTTNGQGVFQNSHKDGTNFVSSLIGAATRNYEVQWSTNLTSWNDLVTLTNASGTINFTNSAGLGGAQFYRTILMP